MKDSQIEKMKILKIIGLLFLLFAVLGQLFGVNEKVVNFQFGAFFAIGSFIFLFTVYKALFYKAK